MGPQKGLGPRPLDLLVIELIPALKSTLTRLILLTVRMET